MATTQIRSSKDCLQSLFSQLNINFTPMTVEEQVEYKHNEHLKLLQDREYRYTHECSVPKAYLMSRLYKLDDINDEVPYATKVETTSPIAYSLFKGFVDNIKMGKRRFLWLCGTPGTGKTMLVATVIHTGGCN